MIGYRQDTSIKYIMNSEEEKPIENLGGNSFLKFIM